MSHRSSSSESASVFDSLHRYFNDIRGLGLLKADEEVALGRRVRSTGDRTARNRLVETNLRLVVKVARSYAGMGLSVEDLVAEGNLGLIYAADRFNPELGVRFCTFAGLCIKQAMRRALTNHARTIRLPAHIAESIFKINSTAARLAAELSREATDDELAEELEMPVAKLRTIRDAMRPVISIDAASDDGAEGFSPINRIADEMTPRPDVAAEEKNLHANLSQAVLRLQRRHRDILARRFGLDGGEPETLDQIGERYGISRERVRQIQTAALDMLRKTMTAMDQPKTTRYARKTNPVKPVAPELPAAMCA